MARVEQETCPDCGAQLPGKFSGSREEQAVGGFLQAIQKRGGLAAIVAAGEEDWLDEQGALLFRAGVREGRAIQRGRDAFERRTGFRIGR